MKKIKYNIRIFLDQKTLVGKFAQFRYQMDICLSLDNGTFDGAKNMDMAMNW